MITGQQIREARELLGWTCRGLARKTYLPLATLQRAEALDDGGGVTIAHARKIKRALEAAGVEFTNGDQPGVRLRKPLP